MATCPVLQNVCVRCNFRGHFGVGVDCTNEKNLNQMMAIFESYADFGLVTRKRTQLIECGLWRYRHAEFVPRGVQYPLSGGIEKWREFCSTEVGANGKIDAENQPFPARPAAVRDDERLADCLRFT